MVDYYTYRAIVALHIFGAFVFLLTHGASVSVAFKLQKERNRERVAALLDLSAASTFGMTLALIWILATAVALGFLGNWFGATWFWTALIGFFVLSGLMTPLATRHFGRVRQSMGVKGPRLAPKSVNSAAPPLSDEELDRELKAVKPWALTIVGLGAIAFLQWLMMFKPF